jgi:hypothetical protein
MKSNTPDKQAATTLVDSLVAYAKNSKLHSQEQVDAIAKSIQTFGFTNPILIDETGEIIAGHGRVLAAKQLGLKEVPTRTLSGMSEENKRAYRIADNRISEIGGGWDAVLLKQEYEELKPLLDFDFALTGWEETDLAYLDMSVPPPDDHDDADADSPYTGKTEVPPYAVIGEKPPTSELYDQSKADALLKQIEEADIDEQLRAFLQAAAYRHTSFNYQQIANFYAHSEPEIQKLMEQSALVIVDFDFAIKNSWTKFNDTLDNIYSKDKGADNA